MTSATSKARIIQHAMHSSHVPRADQTPVCLASLIAPPPSPPTHHTSLADPDVPELRADEGDVPRTLGLPVNLSLLAGAQDTAHLLPAHVSAHRHTITCKWHE